MTNLTLVPVNPSKGPSISEVFFAPLYRGSQVIGLPATEAPVRNPLVYQQLLGTALLARAHAGPFVRCGL